jgi:hypothetical protein
MEKQCETILKEASNAAAVVASASSSQQQLYDAYQKVSQYYPAHCMKIL